MTFARAASAIGPIAATAPAILFTAFEPSGDAHAAPVIAALRAARPDLVIHAWGGPKMRAADANVVETTGHNAAMGAGALAKIAEHRAINRRIDRWLADHPEVALHVPVDSPAANFPICEIARRHGLRVVHLVAPQIWAWGPWRIHKLRRLTDFVLCLLPFEEEYFASRGVPAAFIGHPVMTEAHAPVDPQGGSSATASPLPGGSPRLALLPGSRASEIRHNLRSMVAIATALREERGHRSLVAAIAAVDGEKAALARQVAPELPPYVSLHAGRLGDILRWADAALVCSGTATLDVARAGVPMVVMYRTSRVPWLLVGRWLLRTPHRALPNVVAARRIVPEFIPHFGPDAPIVAALNELLSRPERAAAQRDELRRLTAMFEGFDPARRAAEIILEQVAPTRVV